jgi:hypothetical protein
VVAHRHVDEVLQALRLLARDHDHDPGAEGPDLHHDVVDVLDDVDRDQQDDPEEHLRP